MTRKKYVNPRTETISVCTENCLAVGTVLKYRPTTKGGTTKTDSNVVDFTNDKLPERDWDLWGKDEE